MQSDHQNLNHSTKPLVLVTFIDLLNQLIHKLILFLEIDLLTTPKIYLTPFLVFSNSHILYIFFIKLMVSIYPRYFMEKVRKHDIK